MKRAALIAVLLCAASPLAAATVASPDGRILVTVDADGASIPFYEVSSAGKPLIARSQIAFNFADEDPLRRNLAVEGEIRANADSRWEQPWGERRFVRDHHNELAVTFV